MRALRAEWEETRRAWREGWREEGAALRWGLTFVIAAVVLYGAQQYLGFVETRPGVVLDDPFLRIIPPRDLTGVLFFLVYASILLGLSTLGRHPESLMVGLRAYSIMLSLRLICMYMTPLDPPLGMVALPDPVLTAFGVTSVPTRDLFFSGHTGTLCVLWFTAESTRLRWVYAIGALLVGAAVLIQHIHYTADVVVAPLAAYTASQLARLSLRRRRTSSL
jgi:hypothetical protein